MSLKNPEISKTVLASLYKQTLISEPGISKQGEPTERFRFLGNNERNITIVCSYQNEMMLPDQDLQLLTKMLGACKLSLADVAILNTARTKVEIEELKKELHPASILLFGVEPVSLKLPLQFPHFKVQAFDNMNFVSAPSLSELNQDGETGKQNKTKLWTCLKQLFNI